MNIKKGDNVIVLTGKDKGKKGKIVTVLRSSDKVIVEGINIYKKHQRAKKTNEKGTTLSKAMPIHVSNVKKID